MAHPCQDALSSLNELYSLMKEEDLWAGLWQTHAYYHETKLVSKARAGRVGQGGWGRLELGWVNALRIYGGEQAFVVSKRYLSTYWPHHN